MRVKAALTNNLLNSYLRICLSVVFAHLTDKASKEEPALANGRSGRKRHYSSPSDDGAPEVVVDTADEPPAKRARLQELSPVSGGNLSNIDRGRINGQCFVSRQVIPGHAFSMCCKILQTLNLLET
ncbi:hypothetical protein DPMN_105182 [Dreissena polymorpha]|uniref:Uncharacterized protein n=1 Tax=Dreissena polymorpha TaxID=45954 RepID=A0A9D4HBC8_DREPO|nr:hypothetical protein DPMN_105182 [Dreissena polymorpha]